MAEVKFEIMQNWHLPTVMKLERALFAGEEWSRGQFESELELVPESRMYWVAKQADRIIGYCGLLVVDDFADIATIAVVPELRKQGIGSQMMQMMTSEALRRGASRMLLEVRTTNQPAIDFYTKLGFQIIDERPNYYGPGLPAYVMQLERLPEAADA